MTSSRTSKLPKRILIVDDSRVSRELIKVYLIARDVELLEASDGIEAIQVARRSRPDLVLADLRMPQLDGLKMCQAMRADATLAQVPVVILTSLCDERTEARLHAAGARAVLRKPIQPRPLLEALARHLPARDEPSAGGGAAEPTAAS